jgi:hypothetical protein
LQKRPPLALVLACNVKKLLIVTSNSSSQVDRAGNKKHMMKIYGPPHRQVESGGEGCTVSKMRGSEQSQNDRRSFLKKFLKKSGEGIASLPRTAVHIRVA